MPIVHRTRIVLGIPWWLAVVLAVIVAPFVICSPASADQAAPPPALATRSDLIPPVLQQDTSRTVLSLPPANHDTDPHPTKPTKEPPPPPQFDPNSRGDLSSQSSATPTLTADKEPVTWTPVATEDPRPPIQVRPIPISTPTSFPTPTPTLVATVTVEAVIQESPQSASEIEYVVIISIDGMRPDSIGLTDTPNHDKLRKLGSFSPNAQTISLSITLPSHASMLSGMVQDKHGILFGLPYIGWPGMNGPTVFTVAHDAGLSTGMVFGKNKLSYISLPGSGSVDHMFSADVHDPEVVEEAIKLIEEDMPHVLFIHLPDVDRVGHSYGWMSENQLWAISYADGKLGEIIEALDENGYLDRTLLIVTADHGGHGRGHGDDAPEDRTIPWLAVGPGVPQNHVLTSEIRTFDTAATALYALNLPVPEQWDGRPVLEIFPSGVFVSSN